MLEVTVKTLDSHNHSYSVADDTTVKQFKEKIASSVGIPADKQRLIYQGKVLQDDKKLSDYDVNGKVVHLVQRPPPSVRTAQTSTATRPTATAGGREPNSFLLGAFTVPSDAMDSNQVQQIVEQVVSGMGELGRNATVTSRTSDDGSSVDVHINLGQVTLPMRSESHMRLNNARQMLRMAHESLDILENVNRGQGRATTSDVPSDANVAESTDTTEEASTATVDGASPSLIIPESEAGAVGGESEPSSSSEPSTTTQENQNSNRNNGGDPTGPEHPRTIELVDLLSEVSQLQQRLQPHLDNYQRILRSDPNYEGKSEEMSEDQKTFNIVSDVMHSISHVYHTIGDLMVDLSQPPPRCLRATPIPSTTPTAILHQSIPVQAQINLNASSFGSLLQQQSAANSASTPTTTSSSLVTTSSNTSTNASASQQQTPQESSLPQRPHPSIPSAAGFLSGQHPVVFMELSPSSVTANIISATVVTAIDTSPTASTTNRRANIGVPITGGPLPHLPPQEFFQNLMQAMSQAAAQRHGTNGQSQARGHSGTSTTSSTHTRSTPSAHPRQPIPLPLPNFLPLMAVDPFLPCASRHFLPRMARNGNQQPQQQQPQAQRQGQAQADNAENQLAGMIGNIVSSLLAQPNPHLHVQTVSRLAPDSTSSDSGTNADVNVSGARSENPFATLIVGSSGSEAVNPLISRILTSVLQRQGNPGLFTDEMFNRLIDGITAAAAGQDTNLTIGGFLNSLGDGFQISQREGLFNEAFVCVVQHLTFSDVVSVCLGRTEPLNRLYQPLREFVQAQIMHNKEPSEENIDQAVAEIMQIVQEYLEEIAAEAQVKDDIDYKATMNKFILSEIKILIRLILNATDDSTFGRNLYEMVRGVICKCVALHIYCLRNGIEDFEILAQSRIRHISSEVSATVQQYLLNLSSQHIRGMVPFLNTPEDQIRPFVVYISRPQGVTTSDNAVSNLMAESPTERQLESQSSPMVVETEESKKEKIESLKDKVTTGIFSASAVDKCVPDLEEEEEAVLIGSESWHQALHPDWVPIITRDVQRQRRQAPQPPFSDAYLNGMPAKRRKMMTKDKPHPDVDGHVSSVIPEALRRAVASAGVQPITTLEEMTHDAADNAMLHVAYETQVKNSIKKRLQTDSNYNAEKFPNTEAYFKINK